MGRILSLGESIILAFYSCSSRAGIRQNYLDKRAVAHNPQDHMAMVLGQ